LILQRDEADNNSSTGDPRALHFYFNGMAVGDVGNNGTRDIELEVTSCGPSPPAP
jgi:hypothetical protein